MTVTQASPCQGQLQVQGKPWLLETHKMPGTGVQVEGQGWWGQGAGV